MRTDSETLQHVRALPVFANFGEAELNTLMSHAQINTYKKGKTLFMQGEELPSFYLVLEGWVKTYKGSDAGDEAILQMCSAGDGLMASSVFLDMPALASAQLVQESTLLALPAAVIRKEVQTNGKLAVNVINELALYSQELIQKIEHAQLMSAAERVGWFLLKLNLKQSQGVDNDIALPYDKSTIAAYLDMTPETFSRTLKQFKNKGFHIKSSTVTKPTSNALCSFCDGTLALECLAEDCAFKTESCQH